MANTIPCPNPICTHAFSLAELQSAAQLLCPKCGFRMAGKGAAPVKPAPAQRAKADATLPPDLLSAKPPVAQAKPPMAQAVPATAKVVMATPIAAQPLPPPPMFATAVTAAPPTAPPVPPPAATPTGGDESIPEGSFFNPGVASPTGPLLRSSQPKKKGFNWKKLLIVTFVIGFAASVVIIGFVSIFIFLMNPDGIRGAGGSVDGSVYIGNIRNAKGELEKAYKLVLNKNDWAPDSEIASRFGAHAAWKHKDQDFWFAIVVKDYGMFKPRDAEMLRYGIDKLEAHFGDALELAAKAEPAKIGDLPAQKLQFKGQVKAASWIGDCYMFFKDGIGYWLFMASPDPNVVDQFAAELPEKNFFVITERRGWREQAAPTETFGSNSGKLTMTAPKGVWEKHDAKNEDEKGDLLLFGKYLREKDNTKNALVLIFTLDRQKDLTETMKAARDYVSKKMMSGENNSYKVVHASDVAEGQPETNTIDVGNRRGRMIDLKLQFNDEPKRYYLLAVINEPDSAYGILCECTWTSRQIWRQEFVDLLRTLNVRKGE
jgi:hypothetical protein